MPRPCERTGGLASSTFEPPDRLLGYARIHEGLRTVLPGGAGVGDHRRALDAPRDARAAGGEHSLQRAPAWRAEDEPEHVGATPRGTLRRRSRRALRWNLSL